MSEQELLSLVRKTGEALLAWDAIQRQSRGASPLDSGRGLIANNRESIRVYTLVGQLKQALLDAAKVYAAEQP